MTWISLHARHDGDRDTPRSELVIVETRSMQQTLEANQATGAGRVKNRRVALARH
ncbi:MAG: hypothetical protein P4L71_15525 [Acetobacteraceae bacterium]|nr:hypothetical protein [Acetobacteraceae bacterium]